MSEHVHESITDEARKRTVRFSDIPPGQRLAVTFGEGMDCADQARLVLELTELPSDGYPARLRVIHAELDEKVLESNVRANMANPDMMGGEIWVSFACTYRRGYMPPITLAQKDALSVGRHMFGWIPSPSEENPHQGYNYHAEVLSLELL